TGSNAVQIAWNAYPGKSYVIQTSTNLAQPWQSGVNLTTTNNSIYQSFAVTGSAQFFKVVKLDTDGPEVYKTAPFDGAIGVGLRSTIQAWLRDETGITTNSIIVTVSTNPSVSLSDSRLSYSLGLLTYTPGTNEFLGTNGQIVSVKLSASDTLGNQTANFIWSFQLEMAPVTSPNIVFLDDAKTAPCNLTLLSTNGDYFTFSYAGSCCLANGMQLVSTNFYTGYTRTVVSFTNYPTSNTVIAVTRPTKLAELLQAGTLTSAAFESLTNLAGGRYRPKDLTTTLDFPLQYSIPLGMVLYSDDNFLVETLPSSQLDLNASLKVAANFERFKLKSFQAQVIGSASFELDVHARAALARSYEGSVPLIAPVHNAYGALIGPIPVWVDVVFEVNAGYTADFSALAEITNGISASKTITVGRKWDAVNDWQPIFDNPPVNLTFLGPIWQIEGTADIRAYLQPKVSLMIYSVAGVSADLEPYLELQGSVHLNPPKWDLGLSAGLSSTIGLNLAVWDDSFGDLPSLALDLIPQQAIWHASGPPNVPTAPQIVLPPQRQTACVGSTVSFYVQAQGSAPLSYRWYKDDLPLTDDTRIIGSGSNALRIGSVQTSDAARYSVRVSNQTGSVNSDGAVLTVTAPPAPSPSPRLIWIPPGTFVMGSPTSEALRNTDETQHTVTLTHGFYIGKYAVTQGEYLALIGNNPSWFTPVNGYAQNISRPVEKVSWNDATNYCARLTQQEQIAGRLPFGWVYRLPTESEREYACRAGTTTAFHYGNALHGGMANFYSYYEYDASIGNIIVNNPTTFLGGTTTVGSYQPNAWGLHDMHGNVREWCRDWYAAYPIGNVSDPQGPASGSYRLIRGGGWDWAGGNCRSAHRSPYGPTFRNDNFGFRVVLAPGQP
ncbi:MAG: SUMF1/EgtB/PvdO family nonheme iron enzyme, partial [Verrucomicrobia bacterium]|nr:SUMF1/EgtB/PvdO family nonheme iron enzyme [Verrucomicrobiota bacterium]